MSQQQLFFDLDFAPSRPGVEGIRLARRRLAIQRAVLRWLEQKDPPTGIGVNVVTRISKLHADIAAFWSQPIRNTHEEGPSQILTTHRTVIVQCHTEREDCWPDCIRSKEVLPQLRGYKEQLAQFEEQIRKDEPHLRDSNTLFEEYAEWNYEKSDNRDYHNVKRAIEKMEHSLYHGTKFERIRSAQLADHLYLAVPVNVVLREELADGWGLIWVDDNLNVEVVGEPEDRECLPSNRMHLVQNIGAAAKRATLFSCGVHRTAKEEVALVQPPRGHRRPQRLRLSEM
ncbi:MAG: hypothetical protein A3K18_30300 [Lentisphaerae bacterium RIFOXYA12_64_32]|nr:MAG: hypothetical protein A3K18_30300 [Lentisphaerae bacterium RIFOXYA12_64_32]